MATAQFREFDPGFVEKSLALREKRERQVKMPGLFANRLGLESLGKMVNHVVRRALERLSQLGLELKR